MTTQVRPLYIGFCVLLAPGFGTGQTPYLYGQEEVATGRTIDDKALTILARHLDSIGGEEIIERHQSSIRRGVFDSNAGGMTGKITSWQKPNRFLVELVLEDFGTIRRGYNGDVVWTIHPGDGPMIVRGKAETDLRDANAFAHAAIGWGEDYFDGRIAFAGIVELDGKQVDKVAFQPRRGSEAIRYFDNQTGQLLKTTTTMDAGGRGPVSFDVSFSEFREFKGLTIATNQDFAIRDGHAYQIRLTDVELGPEIPDSRFDLPDEIKSLLDETIDR